MSKQNGGIIGPNNVPTGAFGAASGVWKLSDVTNYKRQGTWPIALTGHQVANSARFETNTYMNKTASSGNTKTFTISFWIKRASLATGNNQFPISFYQDSNNRISVAFLTDNTFIIYAAVGGADKMNFTTNRVFRDTSAWYHIVLAVDTTQATEASRFKMYINGVQETSFSTATYPSQNDDLIINTNIYLGTYDTSNNFLSGYLAEFVYIDGTALDETSFGEFDSQTGIWVPKNVNSLTAGTNGFYLNFQDGSNLGNDVFGGTDLTEYNLTSIDQSIDSCTNNFETLNPLTNSEMTFSEGNLKTVRGGTNGQFATSTFETNSGKWYFESKLLNYSGSSRPTIGLSQSSKSFSSTLAGASNNKAYYLLESSTYQSNSATSVTVNTSPATNDIYMWGIDLDNLKFYIGKNGTWLHSSDPSAGSNGLAIEVSDYYSVATGPNDDGTSTARNNEWVFNFGSPAYTISSGNVDSSGLGNFEYAVPKGFYSLCTKNLNLIG